MNMKTKILLIALVISLASCKNNNKKNQEPDYFNYSITDPDGLVTTPFDGVYQYFDYNDKDGLLYFYLIPKTIDTRRDPYLPETLNKKSFKELSEEFTICVFHTGRKYLKATPELDFPYTPIVPRTIDLYKLDFAQNKMEKTSSLELKTEQDEDKENNWMESCLEGFLKMPSYTLRDLSNKEVLKDMEWQDIADLLFQHPVTQKSVADYNDAAYYLLEDFQKYNEARLILLEVTEKFPNRTVAWLNLADAQWGFDDKEEAKSSYNKYVELINTQGKDTNKIPERVFDRIK